MRQCGVARSIHKPFAETFGAGRQPRLCPVVLAGAASQDVCESGLSTRSFFFGRGRLELKSLRSLCFWLLAIFQSTEDRRNHVHLGEPFPRSCGSLAQDRTDRLESAGVCRGAGAREETTGTPEFKKTSHLLDHCGDRSSLVSNSWTGQNTCHCLCLFALLVFGCCIGSPPYGFPHFAFWHPDVEIAAAPSFGVYRHVQHGS